MADALEAAKAKLPDNLLKELAELSMQYDFSANDVEAFEHNETRRRKSMPGQKAKRAELDAANFMKFKNFVQKSCNAVMEVSNATASSHIDQPFVKPSPAKGGAQTFRRSSLGTGAARMKNIRQSIGTVIHGAPVYQRSSVTPSSNTAEIVADQYDFGNKLVCPMLKENMSKANRVPYTRQSFAGRPVKGQVKATVLGENLEFKNLNAKANAEVEIVKQISEYRWMNTPIEKRAAAINERVEDFEDRLEKHALSVAKRNEGESELSLAPVGRPCPSTVIVIGRVCCESTGRLNERSVMLEGSLRTSHGQRVMLMLADCDDVQLFAGQVIAAVGMPANMGQEFNARQVIPGLPLPRMVVPRSLAQNMMSVYNRAPVLMACAAGPFCSMDSLDYSPLKDLSEQIAQNDTDVLFLMGPLLDANNALVKNGDIQGPNGKCLYYGDIYFEIILPLLDQMCRKAPRCKIYYVPSVNEMLHLAPLPQWSMNLGNTPLVNMAAWNSLKSQPNFTCLSNPSHVKINDLTVAVCSEDVVMSVAGEVVLRPERPRMDSAISLLMQQRHLLPVYPYTPSKTDPVHISQAKLEDDQFPDVFIYSSKVDARARMVEGRLWVNPGQVWRPKCPTAGTYANVRLFPPTVSGEASEVPVDLQNRARVDVIKL